jgi:probable selenium-dependent hydroxylase accessory protein YqeC
VWPLTTARSSRRPTARGREVGDELRAEDVAAVLASDEGGLNSVPEDATAVPVVNMVDSPALERTGRAVAERVLDRTSDVPRVVLTRMVADDPVVAVVE